MSINQFSYVRTSGQKTIYWMNKYWIFFSSLFCCCWNDSQLIVRCTLNIKQIWFQLTNIPCGQRSSEWLQYSENVNASRGKRNVIVVNVLTCMAHLDYNELAGNTATFALSFKSDLVSWSKIEFIHWILNVKTFTKSLLFGEWWTFSKIWE